MVFTVYIIKTIGTIDFENVLCIWYYLYYCKKSNLHKINNYYVGADPGFDQEGGGCPDQEWISWW